MTINNITCFYYSFNFESHNTRHLNNPKALEKNITLQRLSKQAFENCIFFKIWSEIKQ